ncbi:MAG: alkaline phosphatase family protein [Actinobacteria bacterium]|nr:alkaline phosphatase family protein [Actinomycetota bacterium]
MKRAVPIATALVLLAGASVAVAVLRDADPVAAGGGRAAQEDPPASEEAEEEPLPAKAYLRKACRLPERWVSLIVRGWNPSPERGPDLVIVPKPPNYVGSFINTSHSGPYDFLQKVPLIFYGPGHIQELSRFDPGREVTLADIAPTYAEMLGFDFPARDGTSISEILETSSAPPKLIVTVSIDGGGWNLLERWPDEWPKIAQLIGEGVNIEGAVGGSSPSITPAIHTNMSTGAWPARHGVTAIAVRSRNGAIVGAFTKSTNDTGVPVNPTKTLKVTTIGDLWDKANDNLPKVGLMASGNYPLGMLGRGAQLHGGDKDVAAFLEEGGAWTTDPRFYSLPEEANEQEFGPASDLEDVDRADGQADGAWLGHDLATTGLGNTPAAAAWEERTAETILEAEDFGLDGTTDLFYLHFKSPDHVGHKWNMISPEAREVLASVDTAIGRLRSWLDHNIGEDGYVLTITADHGQTPIEAGGWPVNRTELLADVQRRFDRVEDDLGIIQRTSATSLFSNLREMKANGVTPEMVSSYLSRYTIGDNSPEGTEIPTGFEDRAAEPVFSAVFPGRKLPLIEQCSGA